MIEICRRVRVRWTNIKRSIRWARRGEAFEKLVGHRSSRFVDQHYFMRIEGQISFSFFLLALFSTFSTLVLFLCNLSLISRSPYFLSHIWFLSFLLFPSPSSLCFFLLCSVYLCCPFLPDLSLTSAFHPPFLFTSFSIFLSISPSSLSHRPRPFLAIDPTHRSGMLNNRGIKLFRHVRTGVQAINLGGFPFLSVVGLQPRALEKLQRIVGLPRYRRLPTLQNYPNRRGLVKSREKERPVNSIRRGSESWRQGGGRAARRGEYQSREAISTFSSVKSTETRPGGPFFQGTDRTRSVDGV